MQASTSLSFGLATLVAVLVVVFNIHQMLRLESASSVMRPYAAATTATRGGTMTTAVESPPSLPKLPPIHFVDIPPRSQGVQKDLVKAGDYIYFRDEEHWDAAPVVLESHKLVFFTIPKVGCTVWKQLFRRMMGLPDWKSQDGELWLPHNPEANGLKYLYDYSLEEASKIMTSPDWTRAIMVRDPKLRFLSAFLDKVMSNFGDHVRLRCCVDGSCVPAAQTVDGFVDLCKVCEDDHWRSQHDRVNFKYWSYIDHISHVEQATEGAKDLLQKIGAWEEFGRTGWGSDGNSSIFEAKGVSGAGSHATWSQWKVWKWYTPEIEQKVEHFYREDYMNPLFNFTRTCHTCSTDTPPCLTCPEASA